MNCLRLLGLAVIASFPIIAHSAGDALLGVLEEPQCKDGGGIQVRALFERSNGEWRPLNPANASAGQIPKRASWIVSLGGRKLGEIETDDPGFTTDDDGTNPRDRLLNVVGSKKIPSIPNRGKAFGGWCEAPEKRPLVVVANGSVSDPDMWRPFLPSREHVMQLFPQFKARNDKAFICPDPNDATGSRFKFTVKDVRPLKSYQNKHGHRLITLAFKPREDRCDGPDEGWNTQTFFVGGRTTYVGANVTLVDAGDFGSGGSSDLLLWLSGYNKDGYILFSPTTDSRSEYLWSYH